MCINLVTREPVETEFQISLVFLVFKVPSRERIRSMRSCLAMDIPGHSRAVQLSEFETTNVEFNKN